MNDERYVLFETNRERSITKRSASKKVCGSKSTKCKLPYEYLSKKEIRKMSGECKTYNPSKPMNYEAFSKMPTDIQKQYLIDCANIHGGGANEIAEMLGVCMTTVNRTRKMLGIVSDKGFRPDKKKWKSFLTGETASDDGVSVKPDDNANLLTMVLEHIPEDEKSEATVIVKKVSLLGAHAVKVLKNENGLVSVSIDTVDTIIIE